MVECSTLVQVVAGLSLTGALCCPRGRHFIPYLVLVQPRKHPDMIEKLLTET